MEQELVRPRKLEFEPRLLALFLFIAIPFILIGSLLILQLLGNEMNNRLGDNLAELAAVNARYLDTYILVKVTSVSRLSVTPTLTEAVNLANRGHGADARSAHEAILETDNEWKKSGDNVTVDVRFPYRFWVLPFRDITMRSTFTMRYE